MKTLQASLLAFGLLLSFHVQAQISVDPHPIPATKTANLDVDFFSADLNLVTNKFEDYGGASVAFNSDYIEIEVKKRGPKCPSTQPCPDLVPALVTIRLNVIRIEHNICGDVYYAASSAEKADLGLIEQARLEDRSMGRCKTDSLHPDFKSRLTYRAIDDLMSTQPSAIIEFTLDPSKSSVE